MRYRKLRIQDQLREEISFIIQREIKDPGIGFVTILEVKMTEDLKIAKVFCSVYGEEEERKKTIQALQRSKGYIKFLLGKRIQLRYMPDLIFTLDTSFEKIARIEAILRKDTNVSGD
ncbi:30S ribosome-binding factor RbfA [Syntrophorhabdus aromaticivorans]|uniref:Ribosome-binding factor A n=1 Tax=Syntrophorhabdus aromaticivorans TaxID=328301 RepID=A0A351U198_9BACT|nr:30S ribosome-binding factor RbfA [Syntrophorhabdus aromaticivorans]NLW35482.1 30S ribosome-binding factor RbfA [Syntrophorhabdus aromaticivorans]HBA53729.1 30S ribosome-binding factor RbfA [Syntrophorhabdus aromaticivorans]